MILFPFAADTRGGSVHSSYLLIEELLRRGRAAKIALHGEGYARDLAVRRGLPFVDLPALGAVGESERRDSFRLGNLVVAPVCRRAIREERATIIHVNDKRMLRTWCLPTRSTRARLVAHWRSVYLPSWSVDLGLRLASRIISVSTYSLDLLPAWAKAKGEVVHNPIKPILDLSHREEIRTRIRALAGIPPDAAVIGFFGALLKRKRPHVLLDLLRRLKQTADGRPIHGIVCGEALEPRDHDYFAGLAADGIRGRLTAPGYVTNVGEWMVACDVMVAPAVDEPLARVGIEAQSVGLPAIVSSDGGLREVVEPDVSGIVVDPMDFEAWVTAVMRVLDDRAFAQRLAEGGLHAVAKLTIERHTDAVEAVYDRLQGKRVA